MPDSFATRHWLRLVAAPGVGVKTARALLAVYNSPAAIFAAKEQDLRQHVSPRVAAALAQPPNQQSIDAALKWRDGAPNRRILVWGDSDYPETLLNIGDSPPVLYALGDVAMLASPLVAIVGSRNASLAGARATELFARALSDAGVGVASGLAQGIDTAAHNGGLAGRGGTVAVLGTGIDIAYPKINRQLAAQIAERGLLLSEFPLGAPPHVNNFPRRNRVISGISRACLIVEATLKSGSLTTARLAAEQGREVFAVPGSVNSPFHRGCHQLIREGAILTESAQDILRELNIPASAPREPEANDYADMTTAAADEEAAAAAAAVLEHIYYEPTSIDDIVERSGIQADALLPELLDLEVSGKIAPVAGGKYQRIR